ncbi:MAG TPA: lysophospholipid acyltransferase family protein [Sphingomonadaceae bacterium]|nr:lysophospholipid acyltransferase family protein [Sphingomonadaceae bacterium]
MRSLAFYLAFYGGTAVLLLLVALTLPLSGRAFRVIPNAWCAFHLWCVRHLLGIEVVIEGRVPEGGVLVAHKHESFFEAINLGVLLKDPVVFAKEELYRIPIWGWAARKYGSVPVARSEGAKALRFMLAEARRLAASGRPLAIFPEGTRIRHGESPPLRSGFAGIYKLLGLPVVPVAVDSGPLYHRRWKRRGAITYRFGEAIPPGLPREEVEMRVQQAINVLNR